jgi:rhodanese-related sulfurtransferase
MTQNPGVLPITILACVLGGCGQNKFEKELEFESLAVKLSREVQRGGYDLVTTDELKQLLDNKEDFVLIDAMPFETSYKKEHIAGAKNFLFAKEAQDTEQWRESDSGGKSQADFEELLGDDKQALIIVYCGFVRCARSHNGAAWAKQLGYANVKRYAGGIYAWKGKGYATRSAD